jgi:hypothetical protein
LRGALYALSRDSRAKNPDWISHSANSLGEITYKQGLVSSYFEASVSERKDPRARLGLYEHFFWQYYTS